MALDYGSTAAVERSDTKLSTKQSVGVLTEVSSEPAMGGTFWQGEMDTVQKNRSGPAAAGSYRYGGTSLFWGVEFDGTTTGCVSWASCDVRTTTSLRR